MPKSKNRIADNTSVCVVADEVEAPNGRLAGRPQGREGGRQAGREGAREKWREGLRIWSRRIRMLLDKLGAHMPAP